MLPEEQCGTCTAAAAASPASLHTMWEKHLAFRSAPGEPRLLLADLTGSHCVVQRNMLRVCVCWGLGGPIWSFSESFKKKEKKEERDWTSGKN